MQPYQPHKVILAVLFAAGWEIDAVQAELVSTFGPLDSASGPFPFHHTSYYDREMGTPIFRALFSADALADPSSLASLKLAANALEERHAAPGGARSLNVDPGLLSLSRLILATTKQSAHRIAIGAGIHAEVTLLFRKGRFAPLEWTYPDFRSGEYDLWLSAVRRRYREQLRGIDPGRAWRL